MKNLALISLSIFLVPVIMTSAPVSAKFKAIADPIPLIPPVINTVLFSKDKFNFILTYFETNELKYD